MVCLIAPVTNDSDVQGDKGLMLAIPHAASSSGDGKDTMSAMRQSIKGLMLEVSDPYLLVWMLAIPHAASSSGDGKDMMSAMRHSISMKSRKEAWVMR
eukprot:3661617-Pyramimonas_sp.AAC.2